MRARWLARLLLPRLRALAARRRPDFEIVKSGGGLRGEELRSEVYLRRWWLVPRNRLLNVYLHNMLRDDDAVLHDHPYVSVSLVLTDGLLERYCQRPVEHREWEQSGSGNWDRLGRRTYLQMRERRPRQGDLVWRSSCMAHQLVVESEAWTLFVTGPRVREWGFWCPRGWRPWQTYVAASRGSGGVGSGTSGVGRGCGED